MANVSRLDTKQKKQFLTTFIDKHPGLTLVEYNEEVRKRYGRGMDMGSISDLRDDVKHAKALQKDAKRLQMKGGSTHLDEFIAGCEELCKLMDFSPVTCCTFTRTGDKVTFVAEYQAVETKKIERTITK